jgi:hypothetical protein
MRASSSPLSDILATTPEENSWRSAEHLNQLLSKQGERSTSSMLPSVRVCDIAPSGREVFYPPEAFHRSGEFCPPGSAFLPGGLLPKDAVVAGGDSRIFLSQGRKSSPQR